jgi:rhamnogalacturonan hydrolase
MMMIKSNGGSGTLQNTQFLNFIGHTNAYTLNLNAFWSSQKTATGPGVQYKNLTFGNWKGTCSNGMQRSPIQVLCPPKVPCYDIHIEDVNIWTQTGSTELYKCENAFGNGACLKEGSERGTYSTTVTVRTMDAA